jgi:uncharacterized repeat protein (TIGR03803 family)
MLQNLKPAILLGCGMAAISLTFGSTACASSSFAVLHSFGLGSDGANPLGGVVVGPDNNLYGTTFSGGAHDEGTVFRLSLSGTEQIINDTVGSPDATPIVDKFLNVYGTATGYGAGTLFRVDSAGNAVILYNFTFGHAGQVPHGGLITDAKGNLYGTTLEGGDGGGDGAIYEIHIAATSPQQAETTLHSFKGPPNDGAVPYSGLIRDVSGNLYGTTEFGGPQNEGTVFKLSADGTETVLFEFSDASGTNPMGNLLADSDGNLYGTTSESGPGGGQGTIYKVDPTGTETLLYAFGDNGPLDGAQPMAGLVADAKGNLYGTTASGGAHGGGAVFRVSPDGKEKILYSFTGGIDGGLPLAGLTWVGNNVLCGTTYGGGAYGDGTVFTLTLK